MKIILLLFLTLAFSAHAWGQAQTNVCPNADFFVALSRFESDNNDRAVGAAGEISRYQILTYVWQDTTSWPLSYATNPLCSLPVARAIMYHRTRDFVQRFHHYPDAYHCYLLYNCPSEVAAPSPVAAARARKFVKLLNKTN